MKALLIILILTIQTSCLWAEINPFLDPSFQDYVETSYGYMAERKNFPRDLRDALGPIAEIKSPVQYAPRTPADFRTESATAALPLKSRLRSFSPVEKKKLLASLNSFTTEEIRNIAVEGGGKNKASQRKRGKIHFAGESGSLAFAVPPVELPSSGYLHMKTPASGFKSDVYLSIEIPAGAEPRKFLGMVLKELNRDAGFVWKKTVDMFPQHLADSGPNSVPALAVVVSGNVPADGVRKLLESPFVTRIE